jgi:hypothetical protein
VHAKSEPASAWLHWDAPSATRPGDTISGYTVHEYPGGHELTTTNVTRIVFRHLSAGPHWFAVEANYTGGGTSGWSTPSSTVTVAAVGNAVVDASAWRRDASSRYGNGDTTPTEPAASVGAESGEPAPTSHHSNGLPFTGGDVLGLTFIGIGLVLMGTAFGATPRRRRPASES